MVLLGIQFDKGGVAARHCNLVWHSEESAGRALCCVRADAVIIKFLKATGVYRWLPLKKRHRNAPLLSCKGELD